MQTTQDLFDGEKKNDHLYARETTSFFFVKRFLDDPFSFSFNNLEKRISRNLYDIGFIETEEAEKRDWTEEAKKKIKIWKKEGKHFYAKPFLYRISNFFW